MPERISFKSPVGLLAIEIENNYVVRISFDDPINIPVTVNPSPFALKVTVQLTDYFKGKRTQFTLPIKMDGITDFQREVLEITRKISFGKTLSYGQIAICMDNSRASRAVGTALACNPLPILIPCHRVVAADGHLTGYLGKKGIAAKKWLLALEGHKIVGEKLV